jgi:type VI secretion system secreted protein VgrG
LRTDAWAVLRGGEGVLLSTSAPAQGAVTSTQMDVAEAVSLFKGAQALNDAMTLRRCASQQQALFSKDAAKAQAEFIEQIDPKAKGKYAGAVNGQAALKAARRDARARCGAAGREIRIGARADGFGRQHQLGDAGIDRHLRRAAAALDHAVGSAHDGGAYGVVGGGERGRLVHARGGIQAIAGNGPVSLQAHTDQLEILADKAVTVISVNDSIEIKAKEKIVLQAGQAAVTLEGGDITFACPGKFSCEGWAATHGDAIADIPFRIANKVDDAQRLVHKTPADGQLDRLVTPSAQPIEYALRYAEFKIKK